ncbi:MAG: hypothetical protein K0R06_1047 [Clostridium sp.]|jgi:flavodoxin|nr:hypothetical protein [Clostridium sp.]
MKKRSIALLLLMALYLTSCNARRNTEANTPPTNISSSVTQNSNNGGQIPAGSHKVLVVYFSRVGNTDLPNNLDTVSSASINVTKDGVQGNSEIVAKMIQKDIPGSDLFEIQRADKLKSDKSISEHSVIDSEGQQERNAKARPKLATNVNNMASYDVVVLAYPTWWYDMPMPLYSFFDEYDLSGKTIVPFCTSGGSGFSGDVDTIAKLEPKATVVQGLEISQDLPANTAKDVSDRLSRIGLTK